MTLRVVLDSNILVSSLLSSRGPIVEIRRRLLEGEFTLCVSPDLFDELEDVLRRDWFRERSRLEQPEIDEFVVRLKRIAVMVKPATIEPTILADPDDDAVIAAAIAGQADLIVSGDKHLLALRPDHRGIRILTAAEFVEVLNPE